MQTILLWKSSIKKKRNDNFTFMQGKKTYIGVAPWERPIKNYQEKKMNNERNTSKELFKMDGKPALAQALPLALQHVVAMIVGCVTPAIIVSGVAGLDSADSIILIQASLVMSAISTLVQLYPLIKTGTFRVGSGLPMIIGISFAYVPTMQAIAGDFDIATILGAQVVGGVIAVIVGIFVKQIRKFFPPLITGTVVFAIGSLFIQLLSTIWQEEQATQSTVPGRTGWLLLLH